MIKKIMLILLGSFFAAFAATLFSLPHFLDMGLELAVLAFGIMTGLLTVVIFLFFIGVSFAVIGFEAISEEIDKKRKGGEDNT